MPNKKTNQQRCSVFIYLLCHIYQGVISILCCSQCTAQVKAAADLEVLTSAINCTHSTEDDTTTIIRETRSITRKLGQSLRNWVNHSAIKLYACSFVYMRKLCHILRTDLFTVVTIYGHTLTFACHPMRLQGPGQHYNIFQNMFFLHFLCIPLLFLLIQVG